MSGISYGRSPIACSEDSLLDVMVLNEEFRLESNKVRRGTGSSFNAEYMAWNEKFEDLFNTCDGSIVWMKEVNNQILYCLAPRFLLLLTIVLNFWEK